jgi:hypothetical protein
MMSMEPRTLAEARPVLLTRLRDLGASSDLLTFVQTDAYHVGQMALSDRLFQARAHPLIAFAHSHGTEGDGELVMKYIPALFECATKLNFQKKKLSKMGDVERGGFVRNAEREQQLPDISEGADPQVFGPDGQHAEYGVAVSPREIHDGPDRHYRRDYVGRIEGDGKVHVISLPCVACIELRSEQPCVPECTAPGGLCGAIWWVPDPTAILGPFWDGIVQHGQRLNRAVRLADSMKGAPSGIKGKDSGKLGGPSGIKGGHPKKDRPDLVDDLIDLIKNRDELSARMELEKWTWIDPAERERLFGKATEKVRASRRGNPGAPI